MTTPLEFTLEFERKGAVLYMDLAKQVKNPLGKELFYLLAVEEVQHAQRADGMYSKIAAGGLKPSAAALPGVEEKLKSFFKTVKPGKLDKNTDNIKAYSLAMEMERAGYKAYSDFLKNAATKEEKEFFERMLVEEKNHLDSIANVYNYLTNAGDWLQEEESRTWNWMNLG
jgi:rubrerythrin